jgi:hypothetical protein
MFGCLCCTSTPHFGLTTNAHTAPSIDSLLVLNPSEAIDNGDDLDSNMVDDEAIEECFERIHAGLRYLYFLYRLAQIGGPSKIGAASNNEWIEIVAKFKDDPSALYSILREDPGRFKNII